MTDSNRSTKRTLKRRSASRPQQSPNNEAGKNQLGTSQQNREKKQEFQIDHLKGDTVGVMLEIFFDKPEYRLEEKHKRTLNTLAKSGLNLSPLMELVETDMLSIPRLETLLGPYARVHKRRLDGSIIEAPSLKSLMEKANLLVIKDFVELGFPHLDRHQYNLLKRLAKSGKAISQILNVIHTQRNQALLSLSIATSAVEAVPDIRDDDIFKYLTSAPRSNLKDNTLLNQQVYNRERQRAQHCNIPITQTIIRTARRRAAAQIKNLQKWERQDQSSVANNRHAARLMTRATTPDAEGAKAGSGKASIKTKSSHFPENTATGKKDISTKRKDPKKSSGKSSQQYQVFAGILSAPLEGLANILKLIAAYLDAALGKALAPLERMMAMGRRLPGAGLTLTVMTHARQGIATFLNALQSGLEIPINYSAKLFKKFGATGRSFSKMVELPSTAFDMLENTVVALGAKLSVLFGQLFKPFRKVFQFVWHAGTVAVTKLRTSLTRSLGMISHITSGRNNGVVVRERILAPTSRLYQKTLATVAAKYRSMADFLSMSLNRFQNCLTAQIDVIQRLAAQVITIVKRSLNKE